MTLITLKKSDCSLLLRHFLRLWAFLMRRQITEHICDAAYILDMFLGHLRLRLKLLLCWRQLGICALKYLASIWTRLLSHLDLLQCNWATRKAFELNERASGMFLSFFFWNPFDISFSLCNHESYTGRFFYCQILGIFSRLQVSHLQLRQIYLKPRQSLLHLKLLWLLNVLNLLRW